MMINPGGQLAPEDIVGREQEVLRLWNVLTRQSLVLSAERRMGKTCLVRKMQARAPQGFITLYQDLEKVHSRVELVRDVYRTVAQELPMAARLRAKAVEALCSSLIPKRLGQLELPAASDGWKPLLEAAIGDVCDALGPGEKLVLIWDEFPLMLFNLKRSESPDSAIQLLDLLREQRHRHAARLRLVLTGSIGLHLVLRSLRKAGNANDATNDLHNATLDPMAGAESRELARGLVGCFPIRPLDPTAVADAIVSAVGGFPYYIHHVADELSQRAFAVDSDDAIAAVDHLVGADHDPAHFGYYVDRIRQYYDPDESQLAFAILDALAGLTAPATLAQCVNFACHAHPGASQEQVRAVCTMLRQDHYLTLLPRRAYDFRWGLVKRWWKENRL